jgi:hypothetical protein
MSTPIYFIIKFPHHHHLCWTDKNLSKLLLLLGYEKSDSKNMQRIIGTWFIL